MALTSKFALREYVLVHVVTRSRLREFWQRHSDSQGPLKAWYTQANRSHWKHIADVHRAFPHADAVGEYTVFNIGGNKYRLITVIDYDSGKVFIRHVMTHAEYDRWSGE